MCIYLLKLATLLVVVMTAVGTILCLLCIRQHIIHTSFVISFSENHIQSQTC